MIYFLNYLNILSFFKLHILFDTLYWLTNLRYSQNFDQKL